MLSRIRSSANLTHDKKHYLKNYDYVVGPKANGERMLLFWGGGTKVGGTNKHLYLMSPAQLRKEEEYISAYSVSLLNTFEYL
jgi:hypothetical protein